MTSLRPFPLHSATDYSKYRPFDAYSPSRLPSLFCFAVFLLLGSTAWAQNNDRCENATPVVFDELIEGDLQGATSDGASTCDGSPSPRDRWYRWVAPRTEKSFVLGAERDDIELSIHTACPGNVDNQLTCGSRSFGLPDLFGLEFEPTEGETYYLRVAAKEENGSPQTPYFLSFAAAGAVSGLVTDNEGRPLADIPVGVGFTAPLSPSTRTDDSGRYRLGGFHYGSTFIYAGFDSPFVAQLHRDIPCPHLQCFASGDLITLSPGFETTVNFQLEPGATITGILTDQETGASLAGKFVQLFLIDNPDVELRLEAQTDDAGRYIFEGLGAGSYAVLAAASGYAYEFWDDVTCLPSTCDPETATPVILDSGETRDIDFVLNPGLTVRGQVRDAASGAALPSTLVQLRDNNGSPSDLTRSDDQGFYSFTQIPPGTYYVSTASDTHIDEIWPDAPCEFGFICPIAEATPIVLEDGSPASGIDFEIGLGGIIRVSLRDVLTDEPVVGRVRLYDDAGEFLGRYVSPDPGIVELPGLRGGDYRAVAFTIDGRYIAQLYESSNCPDPAPDSCEAIVAGTPIAVTEGQESAIEFALEPNIPLCEPDSETLCLNNRRFAVRATWRTPAGDEGSGHALTLPNIDDSGSFWFFDSENTEIVVKVLDACTEPSNRFWVFAAGLTNVEVEISVTDVRIGEERIYTNPIGTAFRPIQDTDAFNTCIDAGVGPPGFATPETGAAKSSSGGVRGPDADAILESLQADFQAERLRSAVAASRLGVAEAARLGASTCTPSATTLCLGENGRFRVEAVWEIPQGESGPAVAVPFRRDTGLFWFFESNNVELIVKVLDACAEPFERFWVFASGLTNVEVQLKVTDTLTGEGKVYRNPQGQSFRPIQDTDAFETCSAAEP